MASTYFSLISRQLDKLELYATEHDEDPAKLKLNNFDVQILEMFCSWLEAWDHSPRDEENSRFMITHLKLIWVQDSKFEDHEFETWPKHIQYFDPVSFGLERKIEQSKPQIEQWCQILLRSYSMLMQYKSSTDHNNMNYGVRNNMYRLLTYRAAEIVSFKNQFEILRVMLEFMSDSWCRVDECTDSNELLEYRNFVQGFSYKAACLVCLYWAKEENEVIATEMNIALFDMLNKIKPCAADITACYYVVLNSNNLLQFDEFVSEIQRRTRFEQTPANFVDFFFEHTILKDDFLILRQRLIVLFTFLTDAPGENAAEEYLIHSQIYALFREDAYLLLPINEMKKDLSNKNMLLSDFMIKIDILIAKFIQLYCRPSDSWNRLEAEKMNSIFFASLERELSSFMQHTLQHTLSDRVRDHVHLYLREIRFLRSLFLQCFETWDDSDEETRVLLCSVVTSLQKIWGQEYDIGLLLDRLHTIRKVAIADLENLLDLELKRKFQMSKQEISAWLLRLSHCSFHCRPSTSNKIMNFMDSILYNMSDLVTYGAYKDVAFRKQIEILEEKLLFLKNLWKLATNCSNSNNLEEFNMLTQVFANNAACLIYVYWAKEANDELPAETNLMLSNMLHKIKPATPDVARMYIGTLKAICLQPYDSLLLEQTAMSFVDYFFEDLATPWKNDFQILRDEVLFYLTFVHHHHIGNAEEIIYSQFDVLFSDGMYGLLPFDDMKGDFSEKKVGLSDLMMNIGKENAKIRQLYCKFPDSLMYNFPRIIGQGFLDCLVQKLRNLTERMISDQKYVPFARYKIITIEEELVFLTPIFNKILEATDLNDTWLEVVNVAYLVEHVISLCFIFYHLISNYIPYFSVVVDRIKDVRAKLEKIKECNNMYNVRCVPHSVGLMSTLLERDRTSEIPGAVVGLEVDEKIIIDNITRGTESLDIVSIVGMGGLGKTTLAKKVYGSSLVQSHFNIYAFTCVSEDHDKQRLLLDILRDIVGVDAITSCMSMTEDDLAHKLKKHLSRQRYFIVLDDIWNIDAWDEVRSSFPDDRNGSRVMFTTRSLQVAKRGQIKCSPYRLRFLTEDESCKLLQMKVFHNDMPPPNLSGVVEVIAKKCNGLPLALVVIAGLLARTQTSLWIEISKRVGFYLSDEGCMNILELSYKHLPQYLRPCLLYLGAFPADSSYGVNKVTLLWIDEGFIKESKTKSLKDVAKEYLYELVDRSLIIVDETTTGEIRTFHVHDLIHDFCQHKCRDENLFQLGHGNAASSFSSPSIYNHYRISVQKLCHISNDSEPSLANTRSLLCLQSNFDYSESVFPLRKFRLAQVLYLSGIRLRKSSFAHVTSLNDLRHIEVVVSGIQSIPSSISNLWNMQSLILKSMFFEEIYLPETLWRMKSLRHVKVKECKFELSDGYELNSYPQLDKVVSFSRPRLSTGKDVEWLLQRLPVVRKLSCILVYRSLDSIEERVETFDFYRKLESLKLHNAGERPLLLLPSLKLHTTRKNCSYLINFPSTLIRLTLEHFNLSSTSISAIMELRCLRILKLRHVSFPGPTWEMEDVTFPNLKYFELRGSNLELWNANSDSIPYLEQLFFDGTILEELPPCFGEISSLKKITILGSPKLKSSALWVQEEQMELGNKVELRLI